MESENENVNCEGDCPEGYVPGVVVDVTMECETLKRIRGLYDMIKNRAQEDDIVPPFEGLLTYLMMTGLHELEKKTCHESVRQTVLRELTNVITDELMERAEFMPGADLDERLKCLKITVGVNKDGFRKAQNKEPEGS